MTIEKDLEIARLKLKNKELELSISSNKDTKDFLIKRIDELLEQIEFNSKVVSKMVDFIVDNGGALIEYELKRKNMLEFYDIYTLVGINDGKKL